LGWKLLDFFPQGLDLMMKTDVANLQFGKIVWVDIAAPATEISIVVFDFGFRIPLWEIVQGKPNSTNNQSLDALNWVFLTYLDL